MQSLEDLPQLPTDEDAELIKKDNSQTTIFDIEQTQKVSESEKTD